jgi:hypothetical protein
MIVPVFAATLLNSLTSQWIAITEALLGAKDFLYFHIMALYQYQSEATIKYTEKLLEVVPCHKDAFS